MRIVRFCNGWIFGDFLRPVATKEYKGLVFGYPQIRDIALFQFTQIRYIQNILYIKNVVDKIELFSFFKNHSLASCCFKCPNICFRMFRLQLTSHWIGFHISTPIIFTQRTEFGKNCPEHPTYPLFIPYSFVFSSFFLPLQFRVKGTLVSLKLSKNFPERDRAT